MHCKKFLMECYMRRSQPTTVNIISDSHGRHIGKIMNEEYHSGSNLLDMFRQKLEYRTFLTTP